MCVILACCFQLLLCCWLRRSLAHTHTNKKLLRFGQKRKKRKNEQKSEEYFSFAPEHKCEFFVNRQETGRTKENTLLTLTTSSHIPAMNILFDRKGAKEKWLLQLRPMPISIIYSLFANNNRFDVWLCAVVYFDHFSLFLFLLHWFWRVIKPQRKLDKKEKNELINWKKAEKMLRIMMMIGAWIVKERNQLMAQG